VVKDQSVRRESFELYVLDLLVDCETVDLLLGLLNNEEVGWSDVFGREFEKGELVAVLKKMTQQGTVRVLVPDPLQHNLIELADVDWSEFDEANWWFARAPKGQEEWEAWTPLGSDTESRST
jgi:hypothetical protein